MTDYIKRMVESYLVEGKIDIAAELKAAEKEADKHLAGKKKKSSGDDDDEYGSTPVSTIKAAALRGSQRKAGYVAPHIATGRKVTGKGAYGTGGSRDFGDADKDHDVEEPAKHAPKKYSDVMAKVMGLTPKAHTGASRVHKMSDDEDEPKATPSGHPSYITSAQAKMDSAKSTGDKEKASKELKSFQKIHSTFQKGGLKALKDMHAANVMNKNVQTRIKTAIDHHSMNESVELDEAAHIVAAAINHSAEKHGEDLNLDSSDIIHAKHIGTDKKGNHIYSTVMHDPNENEYMVHHVSVDKKTGEANGYHMPVDTHPSAEKAIKIANKGLNEEVVDESVTLDEMTAMVTTKKGSKFSTKVRTADGQEHHIESDEHPTAMGLPKFKAHAERVLRHRAMGLD